MANDSTIVQCPIHPQCKFEGEGEHTGCRYHGIVDECSECSVGGIVGIVAIKHAGGRPTKYEGEETIRKANEYIASCVDKLELDGDKVVGIGVNLPKAEGLAFYLGVSRDTIYEWAKIYEEFSDILEAINQQQVIKLINGGLSGKYNPTIAKLVLAKHGYKESTESETTHKGSISIRDLFDRSK